MEKHDDNYIYMFVDEAIQDTGEENIVQIVMDNILNMSAKFFYVYRDLYSFRRVVLHTPLIWW